MLEKLFLQILNMSYIGGIVILFILAARMPLKKTPKKYSYLLWAVALLRLIVPFSFESILSLIPVNTKLIPNDILYNPSPLINTGISNIDHSINGSLPTADAIASVNPIQVWIFIGSLLWIIGMFVLFIYGMASLIRLKRKLDIATCEKNNIYHSDNVDTPFVLGLIRPKIYLPASLAESEREYILLHEQTHIKRFDHVIRFISYLVLCIHWFNPLVWLAFYVSGKDMEMSCDESVISQLGYGFKKDYSQSLLNIASGKRHLGMIPLAFGEGDTKGRIKNILNYRKPMFWIIGFTFFVIIIFAIGLLTDPEKIVLPDPNMVQTIEMEQFNEGSSLGSVIISNEESIENVVATLKGARKTMRFSTNDYPMQSNYLIVRLNQEDERRTLCLYSENGNYYIEEPYVGIYKSDRSKSVEMYKVYTGNDIKQVEGTDGSNELGLIDTWVQKPSKDPVETAKSAIENQIEKEYTLSVKVEEIEVDNPETERVVERYSGSELAEKRGWTDKYLAEHFVVVKANYYVEYDHTKTFMDDGYLEQYFYLTRDIDTGEWTIIDNSSTRAIDDTREWEGPVQTALDIETLANKNLDIIMSSPKESSNPYDYIEAHYDEYEEIIMYGEDSLSYILKELETGNVQGLRKEIMIKLSNELLGKNIGFISGFEESNMTSIVFDPLEWITLEDTDRIEELEIFHEMPNGYYIHNPEVEEIICEVDENTEYRFIDWGNDFASSDEERFYSTKDKEEFVEYLNTYSNKAINVPFWITIKDGVVQVIEEQYVP